MGTTAAKEANAAPSALPISENEELLTGNVTQAELDEKYSYLKSYPPKGYRVLGVQAQSPASFTGLVAYFDFIVAANNIPLKSMDTTFISLIKVSKHHFCLIVICTIYSLNVSFICSFLGI